MNAIQAKPGRYNLEFEFSNLTPGVEYRLWSTSDGRSFTEVGRMVAKCDRRGRVQAANRYARRARVRPEHGRPRGHNRRYVLVVRPEAGGEPRQHAHHGRVAEAGRVKGSRSAPPKSRTRALNREPRRDSTPWNGRILKPVPQCNAGPATAGALAGLAVVASPMVEPRGDERLPQTPPSRLGWSSEPDPAAPRFAEATPSAGSRQADRARLAHACGADCLDDTGGHSSAQEVTVIASGVASVSEFGRLLG